MPSDGKLLKKARESAALTVVQAAALVGVDEAQLTDIETGDAPAAPRVLESFARAFGISIGELLSGHAIETPSSILFRSLHDSGPGFQSLAESGALLTLGDFIRCVRAVYELRALLDMPSLSLARLEALSDPTIPVVEHLHQTTERLAMSVREELGLGTRPVESMLHVFERLGVDLFLVTPDELDATIDAASTITPFAATLVNLVGGSEQWWRTRATLAHELCHLLVDRSHFGDATPVAVLSPGRRIAGLPHSLDLLERRARAFAVHFLIPRQELERILVNRDPRSESAVTLVCQHFQVGRQLAVNQLRNIQVISEDERGRILARKPASSLQPGHPDAKVGRVGLRAGVLRDLVMRAVAKEKISPLQARSYLEIAASDPLPKAAGLAPQLRAPLVKNTQRVERVVVQRLASAVDLADCFVDRIELEGDIWRAEIAQFSDREDVAARPRGFAIIGPDLQIIEEHFLPRSHA